MKYKVFIDGQEGTTGLRILDRLENRDDIEILRIDEDLRKSSLERKRLINESDFTFLCLPDAAAIEAVSMVTNPNVRIIDASTAHRTNPAWAYGFPELSPEHRAKIANSKRVANPGCYASGFNAIVYPFVKNKFIPPYHMISCHAISGYSGGGKNTIAQYNDENRSEELSAGRHYSLGKRHKHIPEMMSVCDLSYSPNFMPIIDDYYNGMVVVVPFHVRTLIKKASAAIIHDMFTEHYKNEYFVEVMPFNNGVFDGFLAANTIKDSNKMQIFVVGDNENVTVIARFDNLGKGASGAAVQSMNIMMGIDEKTGLL